MAFPADGVEATYRNSIDDVAYALNKNHPDHFMVYNLTERTYDESRLGNYVQSRFLISLTLRWCSFPDHNAPPFHILYRLCEHMDNFLSSDPKNVVVVHCCSLLFVGLFVLYVVSSIFVCFCLFFLLCFLFFRFFYALDCSFLLIFFRTLS